jgi:two-component system, cell cycle response regulator DivK
MPKKVLIIEDSQDIGKAMRLLIEMEGYAVSVASTGAEGRGMAVSEKPDLILMDLALPDTSGIDLTQELRALPDIGDVPILCVSSHTQGIEAVVRAAGCQEVFSKSTFIQNFRDTLKRYLDE